MAAIEATGRNVWGVQITHPSGYTGPTHYHLSFSPVKPHSTDRNGRKKRGTSDRVWGRDVEALLAEIAAWPAAEQVKYVMNPDARYFLMYVEVS